MKKFLSGVAVAVLLTVPCLGADDFKLETVKQKPAGIAPAIEKLLSESAYKVTGPNGVVCEIWLVKELPVKSPFEATLNVKYPFTPGELMGVIKLPTEGGATDFKGQELPAGTFTLRYGQQPQDGNHLGTSDVSDFVLACSPETDKSPAAVSKIADLFKLSAAAAGTTHPAIFLLSPPPEKAFEKTGLMHNSEKEFWILETNVPGKAGGKDVSQPVRIVVSGRGAG
ncbi:MAG: hypothetical protein U0903_11405 [Planctomycetales bacterium]